MSRLIIAAVVVALFVFAWSLAQGVGEAAGSGLIERLVLR